jgi:hypothetical protein
MSGAIAFKSGKDLGEETRVDDEETVTCEGCGTVESADRAYEAGWQIEPAVCPDCLRWTLTDEGECCCGGAS